jgi:hypothetical protein
MISMGRLNTGEITRDSIVVVIPDQITSVMGDESVILSLNDGMYYGLDGVGTRIWRMLGEPRQVGEICAAIEADYDVTPEACEVAVTDLLRDLLARELVELKE